MKRFSAVAMGDLVAKKLLSKLVFAAVAQVIV